MELTGILRSPPGPPAEGLFDYRAFLAWQGIYFQLHCADTNDWRLIETADSQVEPPLTDRFLAWSQRTLARGLPAEDEELPLLWAMALGWKTALTDKVAEPSMRSGTMHICAISGLHIALIAGILVAVLRRATPARCLRGYHRPRHLVLHRGDGLAVLGYPLDHHADRHHRGMVSPAIK